MNKSDEVRWIPLPKAYSMIKTGVIVGSASVIGVLEVLGEKSRSDA